MKPTNTHSDKDERKPQLRPPPKLKGLDFTRDEALAARNSGRLLSLALFTSARCNLKCRYCYISAGRRLPDELKFDEYKAVIDQARDLGALSVWVPGAGEPLLHENLKSLIKYVDKLGMWFVLFTNGTLVSKDWARFFLDHRVSVVVKLNSFDPRLQDWFSGRRGISQDIARAREVLLQIGMGDGTPTRLGVESVIVQQNIDEIPAIFKWARTHNIYPYLETLLFSGRAASNSELQVPAKNIMNIFRLLLAIDEKEFGYTWVPSPPYVASSCDKLLYNITVDSTGQVHPCCGIATTLGSVRKKPLANFLENPIMQALRHPESSLHGPCHSCASESCLYGCRSQAETAGDMFGPCPTCWVAATGLERGAAP